MAKLPIIMYDQDHYYRVYFFEWWIHRKQYEDSLKISGYAPEGWILYTQAEPNPFFFGAYPEESLEKESQTEFSNLKNKEYVQHLMQTYPKMFDIAKEISKDYFQQFYGKEKEKIINNPDEVVAFFKKLKETMRFFCSYYLLTQPQRFFEAEKQIKQAEDQTLLTLIEQGSKLTKLTSFRKVLLNLANEIISSGLNADEFFEKFNEKKDKLLVEVNDLGFLTADIFGGELTTKENVISSIKKILENPDELIRELQTIEKTEEKIKSRQNIEIGSELHQIADTVGELLVHRFDTNTYTLCLANYYVNLIKAIEEVYELEELDLQSYKLDEIFELLENGNKVEKELLEKRKQGYLQIHNHDKYEEYIGEEAREKIKDLLEERKKIHEESTSLKGAVASFPNKENPIVSGEVFVMTSNYNSDEKLKSFKEGDILVTTQTHPALVPAMKRAAAIITDEGGLTCHAAIVSRELEVPCVIGTKIATKILKTGNKVQMNLNKGTINIL
jgi:phosphohistidine swiveling domain-containing protein